MARDWIQLHEQPIALAAVFDFLAHESAGGIDIFLGTTRSETNPAGQQLSALDYEAYAGMAVAQFQDLAARARDRWPVRKLVLLHRTGRVPVGQPSVVVAVSTPHRAEAFEACRWLIDALKAEVAIWKKKVWADGSGTWVEGAVPTGGGGAV